MARVSAGCTATPRSWDRRSVPMAGSGLRCVPIPPMRTGCGRASPSIRHARCSQATRRAEGVLAGRGRKKTSASSSTIGRMLPRPTSRRLNRVADMKRIFRAAILALLVGTGVQSGSAQTLTVRYGQAYSAARSIFSLPVAIAEREGFFSREQLDVRILQPIPGGADHQITALHNDGVDLTHVATPFLIRAALSGSDAVAIAAE